LILDLEFGQHLGSLKLVTNIIMWFRDMGCYRYPASEEEACADAEVNPCV
jgi:hypothetical protein